MWTVLLTLEVKEWLDDLAEHDSISHRLVVQAVDVLADEGPALGRPLVDRVKGSRLHNLKELRPGSTGRTEIRILFAFDPWRRAVLLVAGDKAGSWSSGTDVKCPGRNDCSSNSATVRWTEDRDGSQG